MMNLQDICDLPIEFDNFENRVRIPDCVHCDNKTKVSISSLSHTLLNSAINYPENVYEEYCVHMEEDDHIFSDELNYNLVVIPPGLLGIEFIKSHIFYSPLSEDTSNMKFSTIVEGVQGIVTVLMQKNSSNFDPTELPSVEDGIMIELYPKDKIAIPEGYFYTFVNATEETVILSRVFKTYSVARREDLSRTKGMAYFCIRKNAKQEFVYNPRFRDIPSIRKMNPSENHMPDLGFDLKESLYELAKLKTEKFLSLLA